MVLVLLWTPQLHDRLPKRRPRLLRANASAEIGSSSQDSLSNRHNGLAIRQNPSTGSNDFFTTAEPRRDPNDRSIDIVCGHVDAATDTFINGNTKVPVPSLRSAEEGTTGVCGSSDSRSRTLP